MDVTYDERSEIAERIASTRPLPQHPPALRSWSPGSTALGNWMRHRLDVAHAHATLRQYAEAVAVLEDVKATAPQWLAQQHYARDIVQKVIDRRRTLTPPDAGTRLVCPAALLRTAALLVPQRLRGLLLAEHFSEQWNWYATPEAGGKVVWALLAAGPSPPGGP